MKRKASFTVEMSLITPVLCMVILLVMELSFYLYNRVAITAIVTEGAIKGVQMESASGKKIEKEIAAWVEDEINTRLVFAKDLVWNVKANLVYVQVEIQGKGKTWIKPLTYRASYKINRLQPAYVLWEKERLRKK